MQFFNGQYSLLLLLLCIYVLRYKRVLIFGGLTYQPVAVIRLQNRLCA